MRIAILSAILAYIAGVLLITELSHIALVVALVLSAIISVVLFLFCRRFAVLPVIVAMFLAFGGWYGAWRVNHARAPFEDLWDKPITLTCRIDGLPSYGDGYLLCNAEALSAATPQTEYPLSGKIQIRCFTEDGLEFPAYGETVSFKTKLTLPAGTGNDGGFDYSQYLLSKGIYASCDAYDYAVFRHGMAENINPLMRAIFALKASLLKQIDAYFTGDERAFIKAALLGVKDEISEPLETGLRRSGLSHLVSVSGLHFSIFMLCFSSLLRFLPFRHRRPVKLLCYPFVVVFLMAITGFQPPVVRAGIMVLFAVAAEGLFREHDTLHSLMLAALLMLIHNPFAIYDLSFVLSFSAVLGIALFLRPLGTLFDKLHLRDGWFRQSVCISLASQIFTTPILLWQFNGVATISILSNLVAVPIMPFFICGCLVFLPLSYLWQPLAQLAAGFTFMATRAMLVTVRAISAIPFSYLQLSGRTFLMNFCFLALVMSAICVFFLYRCKRIRITACCVVTLVITLRLIGGMYAHPFTVTCLNVGQGDCQIIRTPGRQTVLIDGGGMSLPNSDTADKYILPYLHYHGISRIDCAMVTHYHDDHTEGIISLLSTFPVKRLVLPDRPATHDNQNTKRELLKAAEENGVQVLYAAAGDALSLDHGISLQVLSPQEGLVIDENNSSMVLRLSQGERRFLFTGDIELKAEEFLLANDLDCDVLKIAHHGSDTSSCEEFLDAASPDYAMIGVGKGNRYGHPAPVTLERLQKRSITCYRTDQNGQITFRIYRKNGSIIPTVSKEVSTK